MMKVRSPYRPLDLSWVPADARPKLLNEMETYPWTKDTVYMFDGPLPERFIEQWSLEVLQ